MTVIVRRIFRINHDVTIVIRRTRVVAPNICVGNLVIRVIGARRQVCLVSKHLSDRENSCGRAAISFLRRPDSFCPEIPVPHARPFFPNNTGNGPATTFHSPPRGRSNNCKSPRIEFHVGAIPIMSCVQSSGTPSANIFGLMKIERYITKLHNFIP